MARDIEMEGLQGSYNVCERHARLQSTYTDMDRQTGVRPIPEFEAVASRIIGTMKQRHKEDLEAMIKVLPDLWQTQEAIRDLCSHFRATYAALQEQEEALLEQLSDTAKEAANEFTPTSIGGYIYRLTAQNVAVRVDLSEVRPIEELIYDLSKDERG